MFPGDSRQSRAAFLRCIAAPLFAASVLPSVLHAQPEESGPPPEAALEAYLEERGLRDLLVTHLLQKLRVAEPPERGELAERLSKLYVQMLEQATTPEQRRSWERRATELLEAVPEAESLELRITLAKARYLQVEDTAEHHRLRLVSPEQRQEAETTFRSVNATLRDIGNTLTRRIDSLERREAVGRNSDSLRLRSELAEARRLRSLAMYYAGWSAYYSGLLAGQGAGGKGRIQYAEEALTHFGWLLNAPGRPANVERVSPDMLRYEHVARAAIGAALSESLRGRDGAALLWLHTIESAPALPENARNQLFTRRLVVLAAARRWADIDLQIRRRRAPDRTSPPSPLTAAEARLLAVTMLEAMEDRDVVPQAHDVIRSLADVAVTDLITRGEANLVKDLVSRYGSGLLSGEGFIVQYVRGLHAYDKAREAHAAGEDDSEPTRREEIANLYAAAGHMFDNATESQDAPEFIDERADAAMLGALCLYYSGRLEDAATRFEETHRLAYREIRSSEAGAERNSAPDQKASSNRSDDSLWMAIVALDKAVEGGRVSLKDRLERLATLYVQRFPAGDRSAMLLLRLSDEGIVSRERAAEILLAVGKESPLYESARRHAADLLYAMFRRSRGMDRDFAALRFAEVCDELLALDLPRIDSGTEEGRETAQRAVLRLRQVLDAVLGITSPDMDRADRALQQITMIAQRGSLDISTYEDEIAFRRLQVALLRNRPEDASRAAERLSRLGGRFSDAADRLMYQRALTAMRNHRTPETAAEVVHHGMRIVSQFGTGSAALSDPVVQTLYSTVAEAAAYLWQIKQNPDHRDIAVQLDGALVGHGRPPVQILRRYAELAESAGKPAESLESWRLLMVGLAAGTSDWFEARFHSLRLLAATDPARAKEVFDQFKVLYPSYGEEPWSTRFRELERSLESRADSNATSPAGRAGAKEP